MITKTRMQGNAITLTVPKSFQIKAGTEMEAELVEEGILYRFVKRDTFFDFDSDILRDVIKEGYQGESLVREFTMRKSRLPEAVQRFSKDCRIDAKPMNREELMSEVGL